MLDPLSPIAPLRPEVQIFPWKQGPFEQLLAYDTQGYAPERIISLPCSFQRFELLNGQRSLQDLERAGHLEGAAGHQSASTELRKALQLLDDNAMLLNNNFEVRRQEVDREFVAATVRPAFHAGSSYPDSAAELKQFVDDLLKQNSSAGPVPAQTSSAVIAPHIDLKIGAATYAPAYQSIAHATPDLVVVLATSHYGRDDWFMPLFKDLETPLGQVETARDIWQELDSRLGFDLCREERAHRIEHSIEFHIPFIQRLYGDRCPRVLPLLIGSFYEFVRARSLPRDSARFVEFVDTLKSVLDDSGLNVVYVASVDFAHIGRKFGDSFDAHTQFTQLREEDRALIEAIRAGDSDRFFRLVSAVDDKRRICGLSPIYTLMQMLNPQSATLLDYQMWDERERASAVSYAALRID